ncbi:MAG TPA: hypothetical protein VKT82_16010 [Ktedonobacterales bacterium]|nr:hypothetical protein [Ktedonobacterales bacterium]
MAQEIEKLVVDIERPIGCIARAVFWILFVLFGAVLGVLGWLLYTSVFVNHPIPLDNHQKDALIVILSGIVLATMLAALVRDTMRRAIYRWVARRQGRK